MFVLETGDTVLITVEHGVIVVIVDNKDTRSIYRKVFVLETGDTVLISVEHGVIAVIVDNKDTRSISQYRTLSSLTYFFIASLRTAE